MKPTKFLLASLLPLTLLAACGGGSNRSVADAAQPDAAVAKPVAVTIAHVNDVHSNLAQTTTALTLGGIDTTVQIGGFGRVKAAVDQIAAKNPNTLKLHAGDALVGTLYYTLFQGRADAELMNTICFDAMTVGNHEFDDGDAGLKRFIDDLHAGNCKTPMLSANVTPQLGTPLAPQTTTDYIKPFAIKEIGGEKIGIVGLTVVGKTVGSSRPLPTTAFANEVTAAQKAIDQLKAQGVRRVVLLSHVGYAFDQQIAPQLTDVDVIVGGDSHTLLGDFSGYGVPKVGNYPTLLKNKDGSTVCVAQAWEYGKAVGELQVNFAADQTVQSCSGAPHLLLGDTFTRNGADGKTYTVAGAELDTLKATIAKDPQLLMIAPDATAESVLKKYKDQISQLETQVIGASAQYLCHVRIPGDASKAAGCTDATRAHGSDIANIVAQAFLAQSLTSDIAIQNAGGVRIDVPAGDVTIKTAYTLLPFANTLTELTMTGAEINAVLEDALDYALMTGGSTGAYPYAAGLRWDVNLSKPKGQRFSNLQVKGKTASAWTALDPAATYKVVSNSYTAQGKDGYLTFKTVTDSGRALDTYLDYAQSFVDYVKKVGTLNKLPVSDYSTQNFYDKTGALQQ